MKKAGICRLFSFLILLPVIAIPVPPAVSTDVGRRWRMPLQGMLAFCVTVDDGIGSVAAAVDAGRIEPATDIECDSDLSLIT
jgi:NCAIR mutase (PurE)-related protein